MERLTAIEGRVVASLVEKALTIPQHYPLTLNTLVAACNQTSSRDPVTSYLEDEVLDAIESLKAKRLARAVLPSHGRSVVRYRHVLDETLGLDAPQLAVLAVLVLRGPQTVAELRVRTERMATADSVDHELELLAARTEPLARLAGRRPGQKEDRWESLLADWPSASPVADAPVGGIDMVTGASATTAGDGPAGRPTDDALRDEVDELRQDVDAVRSELEELHAAFDGLRAVLDDLRASLGG